MSKIVRRVFLAALLLGLSGVGSIYVGGLQSQNEREQFEKRQEAGGVRIYDADFDWTNNWEVIGFLLIFVSIAVLIAGTLLSERDKDTGGD
jgi:hypothetical protein